MTRRPFALPLLLLLSVSGCGTSTAGAFAPSTPATPAAREEAAGEAAPPPPIGIAIASPAPTPPPAPATSGTAAVPAASLRAPLVTYSGQLSLRVTRDPSAAIDAIVAAAESLGGYLSARRDAFVEVRVPSARFREAMSKIEPLGEVTHRAVAATDVTDEFHDAEVRLANLRATRARLQELLAKSGSLADTLTVERELERVALEIDRLEGRLELLKARVALSTLSVSVEAHPSAPPVVAKGAPRKLVALPVKWLESLGTDRLLTLQ
jgi:hypothetical protein